MSIKLLFGGIVIAGYVWLVIRSFINLQRSAHSMKQSWDK